MKTLAVVFPMALALCAGSVRAEVADSASNGFTIRTTMDIQAAPEEVYRRIMRNVGDWWDPAHTYSHDAHNLVLRRRPLGCFCEKLPNSGVVRHMEVIALMPGKSIVFTGALGPLQSIAAAGSMKFQLAAAEGDTKLEFTYAVTGYLPAGLNTWAAPVDSVLKEQLTRLKNYIEHGNPAPK